MDSVASMEFIWYWLDGTGQWIEYGKQHSEHCVATVTSSDLEAAFLANPRGTVRFSAGSQQYELNFQDMVQRNLFYQTQRKVCRWPRCCLDSSSLPFHLIPSDWDHSTLPDIGYKLVVISKATKEYNEIKKLFEKSMEGFVIRRLLRNQNPSLWQVFQWQKEQMKKKNGGRKVDERLLFHGTSTSHLHDICGQNFDWRICGTHGTLYGKGSYFAKDASYSHQYCQSDTRFKMMFVARVLVGDYIQGNTAYLRPPPRPDQCSSFYDSCVDHLPDPSIFVVFEKHQIYPEYVIEYEPASWCIIM